MWPLEGPFYASLLSLWVVVPGWVAARVALMPARLTWARWLAGCAGGLCVAVLNTAIGSFALQSRGAPDQDWLWPLIGLAWAAGASAVGALAGALRLR